MIFYECINYDRSGPCGGSDPWGGTSLELLTRISSLESTVADLTKRLGDASAEIQRISGLRASYSQYGFAMLSDSSTATRGDGLVLPTSEKNAAIDDTLANRIEKLDKKYGEAQYYDLNNSYAIQLSGSDGSYAYRCGIIVFLKLTFRPSNTAPGLTNVIVLPDHLKPRSYLKFGIGEYTPDGLDGQSGKVGVIMTDGRVIMDCPMRAGNWYFYSTTYIARFN